MLGCQTLQSEQTLGNQLGAVVSLQSKNTHKTLTFPLSPSKLIAIIYFFGGGANRTFGLAIMVLNLSLDLFIYFSNCQAQPKAQLSWAELALFSL